MVGGKRPKDEEDTLTLLRPTVWSEIVSATGDAGAGRHRNAKPMERYAGEGLKVAGDELVQGKRPRDEGYILTLAQAHFGLEIIGGSGSANMLGGGTIKTRARYHVEGPKVAVDELVQAK